MQLRKPGVSLTKPNIPMTSFFAENVPSEEKLAALGPEPGVVYTPMAAVKDDIDDGRVDVGDVRGSLDLHMQPYQVEHSHRLLFLR